MSQIQKETINNTFSRELFQYCLLFIHLRTMKVTITDLAATRNFYVEGPPTPNSLRNSMTKNRTTDPPPPSQPSEPGCVSRQPHRTTQQQKKKKRTPRDSRSKAAVHTCIEKLTMSQTYAVRPDWGSMHDRTPASPAPPPPKASPRIPTAVVALVL